MYPSAEFLFFECYKFCSSRYGLELEQGLVEDRDPICMLLTFTLNHALLVNA
jgi:hypothetical protein